MVALTLKIVNETPLVQITFKVASISAKYNDIKYTSHRKLYFPSQDQPNFIVPK